MKKLQENFLFCIFLLLKSGKCLIFLKTEKTNQNEGKETVRIKLEIDLHESDGREYRCECWGAEKDLNAVLGIIKEFLESENFPSGNETKSNEGRYKNEK